LPRDAPLLAVLGDDCRVPAPLSASRGKATQPSLALPYHVVRALERICAAAFCRTAYEHKQACGLGVEY